MIPKQIPSSLAESTLAEAYEYMLRNGFSRRYLVSRDGAWTVQDLQHVTKLSKTTLSKVRRSIGQVSLSTADKLIQAFLAEAKSDPARYQVWHDFWFACVKRQGEKINHQAAESQPPSRSIIQPCTLSNLSLAAATIDHSRMVASGASWYDDVVSAIGTILDRVAGDLGKERVAQINVTMRAKNFSSAEALLTSSIVACPPNDFAKAQLILALAELHFARLELPSALTRFEESVAVLPDPAVFQRAGEIAWLCGHYLKAIEFEELWLRHEESKSNTNADALGDACNNLGLSYAAICEFRKAEELYWRALDLRDPNSGGNDIKYTRTLNNLLATLAITGQRVKAEQVGATVLKLREQAYQEALGTDGEARAALDYSRTLIPWGSLWELKGTLSAAKENWQHAKKCYDEALEIRRRHAGECSSLYAQCLYEHARFTLEKLDVKNKNALSNLEAAVDLTQQIFGDKHVDTNIRKCLLAKYHAENKGRDAALATAEAASNIVKAWLGETHIDSQACGSIVYGLTELCAAD